MMRINPDNERIWKLAEIAVSIQTKLMRNLSLDFAYIDMYDYDDYKQECWSILLAMDVDESRGNKSILDYMLKQLEWRSQFLHTRSYYSTQSHKTPKPRVYSIEDILDDDDKNKSNWLQDKSCDKKEPTIRQKIAEWVVKSCLTEDDDKNNEILYSLVDEKQKYTAEKAKLKSRIKTLVKQSGGYYNLFGDKHTTDNELQRVYDQLLRYDLRYVKDKDGKLRRRQQIPSSFVGVDPTAVVSPKREPPKCDRKAPRASRIGKNRYQRKPNGTLKFKFVDGRAYRVLINGDLEDTRVKYKLVNGIRYRTLLDGGTEQVLD